MNTMQPSVEAHTTMQSDVIKITDLINQALQAKDKVSYYAWALGAIDEIFTISSSEMDSISKLIQNLHAQKEFHYFMITTNHCIQYRNKARFLNLPYASKELWRTLISSSPEKQPGFAKYKLVLSVSHIRAVEMKINELNGFSKIDCVTKCIKGICISQVYSSKTIRLALFEKPSSRIAYDLSCHFGFKRGNSDFVWFRTLNKCGLAAADRFIRTYEPGID